ncbi:galactose-6-phosphate isomerase subunit LacB [Histophilus somni]|uniref:galactose-6-phosphate isomerase subunit LacB n=1 Tax=Histophilus somni TaxID=731 RepID=UPI00201F363F|nr:galactose-6-phosphate isomerase subunit LacB [Histophilus somni]
MKLALGNDHIVTDMKFKLKKFLEEQGHEVIDVGTYDYVRTHYPIYGKKVAEKVVNGEADLGIVMCGTGVGITNSAQKIKGTRVALVTDVSAAKEAKEKYNANIIGVGGRVVGQGAIEDIVATFLETEYKPTNESEDFINKVNQLYSSEESTNDEHYFDEFLKKWDNGEYHD